MLRSNQEALFVGEQKTSKVIRNHIDYNENSNVKFKKRFFDAFQIELRILF